MSLSCRPEHVHARVAVRSGVEIALVERVGEGGNLGRFAEVVFGLDAREVVELAVHERVKRGVVIADVTPDDLVDVATLLGPEVAFEALRNDRAVIPAHDLVGPESHPVGVVRVLVDVRAELCLGEFVVRTFELQELRVRFRIVLLVVWIIQIEEVTRQDAHRSGDVERLEVLLLEDKAHGRRIDDLAPQGSARIETGPRRRPRSCCRRSPS